ncbi:hypothetical protein PILCRDRAFT_16784 [Piloderma croceum F 1598]|uniref:Uncharacterized protein n=1 Tax=Piloderma croceum (strain F 1598) TaxID=765440 RepID=A0A0C3B375_PILCF|nr:hypothetical protein PILCRDRAFT_16784 [Piloderma croceum F 1598]
MLTLSRQLSIQIRILKQVQALNSHMISNSNSTSPGVPPPLAYTQAILKESGTTTPTLPDPKTLPSNPDEIHTRLHAFRKKDDYIDSRSSCEITSVEGMQSYGVWCCGCRCTSTAVYVF